MIDLFPVNRLVKAKSDGSLYLYEVNSSLELLSKKIKSRSLEPLSGLIIWSNPVIIELQKTERGGLGFSILDYQDPVNVNDVIIIIRSLVPGGVAQLNGQLMPGDRLLAVNDISLEKASLDLAVQVIILSDYFKISQKKSSFFFLLLIGIKKCAKRYRSIVSCKTIDHNRSTK